jgi:hypothetical protein
LHSVAQQVQVMLVDDLDGSPADETVSFALDGVAYQIDLSAENAEALREALAPFLGHARRARGGSARRAPKAAGKSAASDTADIRAWAKAQGIAVSERGRIPASVRAQYDAANS